MLLDTPLCNFGWKAPDFTLRDPNGIDHKMSDHLTDKGLLIAFICNHCPYVQAIAVRLAADSKTLMDEGFGVLAVMPNDYRTMPEDGPAYMKKFAMQFGFLFPYLVDEGQNVAKSYKAVCTPDFFGFNSKGELQYRGRIDDIGLSEATTNRMPELVNAMRQIAKTGTGPSDQKPSMGCSIKWS